MKALKNDKFLSIAKKVLLIKDETENVSVDNAETGVK